MRMSFYFSDMLPLRNYSTIRLRFRRIWKTFGQTSSGLGTGLHTYLLVVGRQSHKRSMIITKTLQKDCANMLRRRNMWSSWKGAWNRTQMRLKYIHIYSIGIYIYKRTIIQYERSSTHTRQHSLTHTYTQIYIQIHIYIWIHTPDFSILVCVRSCIIERRSSVSFENGDRGPPMIGRHCT